MSKVIPLNGILTVGPYMGYYGRAEYDVDTNEFHGSVSDTRDVITFVAGDPDGVRAAFQDSIDEYLAFCEERGEQPEKPFSQRHKFRRVDTAARKNARNRCALIWLNVDQEMVGGIFIQRSLPGSQQIGPDKCTQ